MIANASPIATYFKPKPFLNPWQWARDNVDYSRVKRYETPRSTGKFDPDWLPYWKYPAELAIDPTVRQIVILKCSRAGATEAILNVIRYHVARDPIPIMYVGGQSDMVEMFHKERIALGMRLSTETQEKYDRAQCAGTVITFEDMILDSTYPGSKTATKQTGWPLIVLDEFDMYPDYSGPMFDKRLGTYDYGHIIKISSPDPQQKRPSDESPIFLEFFGDRDKGYGASNQCYWMMPDPKDGKPFKFRLNLNDEDEYGLRWDKSARKPNGKWDMRRVRETAHFVTPSGAVINESEKMQHVARGQWIATNPEADPEKVGLHLSAFYTPFVEGQFGTIATKFLVAKANGPEALRVFIYEYLAEKSKGETIVLEENKLAKMQGTHPKGSRIKMLEPWIKRKSVVVMTIDVQHKDRKDSLYWMVREWFHPGDSATIDFGSAMGWDEIVAVRAKYAVNRVFIDNSYNDRRNEVFEQCIFGQMRGAIPIYGRDKLIELYEVKARDPFAGTAKAGHKIPIVTFNPDRVKHMHLRLITGGDPHQYMLPAGDITQLAEHFMAEESVDGHFVELSDSNHLRDCDVMSLVAAMVLKYFLQIEPQYEHPEAGEPAKDALTQPVKVRSRGVYYPE